jgi:hypothetical protein
MRGLVLLVALWHCLLSCDRCRVTEGAGGERYLEQRSASRGRALGMVEGREGARIRSGKEEVRSFLQFCAKEIDPMVLCRFREFGEMGEAQKVEHSQNPAAS